MQVLILLFSFIHLGIPYFVINDASILRVLFGNVTEMSDLFLPPMDDISSTEESSLEEENIMPDVKEYFKDMKTYSYGQDDDVNQTIYNHDLTEFHTISRLLDDIDIAKHEGPIISRKFLWTKKPEQWNFGDRDDEDKKNIEPLKKELQIKLMLTMVIHIRFKVDMAIRQRQLGRASKGYRLGYLFGRLRRIKYDMAKVLNSLIRQNYERHNYKYRYALLVDANQEHAIRWYEKIMRLDVDSRDIIDLILEVTHEVNPSTTTDSDQ